MRWIKNLMSPLGGAAAVFALWLPWVHLECNSTKVDPTLWQLADQQARLYAYAVLALVLLLVALGMVLTRRRLAWSLGTALVACLGIGAWVYLWIKKDDLGRQQVTMEGLGGSLGAWLQQLHVDPAAGFYLYLAGMLIGLAGAILFLTAPAESSSPGP